MPIQPVDTTPTALGLTIQRAGQAALMDNAYETGVAQADDIRQRIQVRPYLEGAAVAQAKNAEADANSQIALRPAVDDLKSTEIRAKKDDLVRNADLESIVNNEVLKSKKRLLEFNDALFPTQARATAAQAESAANEAELGKSVSATKLANVPAINDALSNDIRTAQAESSAGMLRALELKDDPFKLGQFFTAELAKVGQYADPLTEKPEALARRWSQARADELDRLQKFQILSKRLEKEPFKAETELRKEFQDRPEVKKYAEVSVAFDKIKTTAGKPDAEVTAADDLGTIYSFMKMLDPGSTVREGEFATAQNAAGIPDRIRAMYNKAMNGTRMAADQRANMLKTAGDIFTAQDGQFKKVQGQFYNLAHAYGANPNLVLSTNFSEEDPSGQPAKPATTTTPAGDVRWYNLKDGRRIKGRVVRNADGTTAVEVVE